MLKVKLGLCVVFLLLFTPFLKAQVNSPYSRFGVGDLYSGYPVDLAGYGGLTAASEGPTLLNYANPASYASIQLTTFSTGAYGSDIFATQSNASIGSSTPGNTTQAFQDGSLTNLCIGFPVIKNHWGASFGLVPYSRQSYSIAKLNDPTLGYDSYDSFDDSGSLYKFYVGNGVSFKLDSMNRINIGLNVSYLFGTFSQSDDLAFVDTFNAYNTQHIETKSLGGVVFQGGIQYIKSCKNGARWILGAQGNLQSSVAGHVTNVWDRFVFQDVGNGGIKDTIQGEYNLPGSMIIPASFGAGIQYNDPTHFTLGVNYDYTYWSNFSSFGETGIIPLVNSMRAAVGGQWLPDFKDYHHYFKIVKYSAGFYFEKTNLEFDGTQVNQYALTLGASFPLTHGPVYTRYSTINFALEMGQRGTTSNNLLRERFFTLSVGLTLSDLWFIKRKFD